MLIELIAAFAGGFVGAGIAMILRHLTGGRLPRTMVPIFAGIAMLTVTVSMEYSWYARTAGTLPEDVVIVRTGGEPSAFRPWTYVFPFVTRFMAVDKASIRRNPEVPGQRMAQLLIFTHRAPGSRLPLLMDCQNSRRADIADTMTFDDAGAVTNADWQEVAAGDPMLSAICS